MFKIKKGTRQKVWVMHVNSMLTKYILIVCVYLMGQRYSICMFVTQIIEKPSKKEKEMLIVSFLFYPA